MTDGSVNNDNDNIINLQKNWIIFIFFYFCEKIGIFFGIITSIILNFISNYILVGLEGLNKSNIKYLEIITPSINECKEKFQNKFNLDNKLEEKINNII